MYTSARVTLTGYEAVSNGVCRAGEGEGEGLRWRNVCQVVKLFEPGI
jgi:hypothetical protein